MKFLIILLVLAATVYTEGTEEEEKQWQEFKLEHGKLFLSPGKEAKRKETFLKNARDVQKHNQAFLKKDATYAKGINKHSDLTDEEFLARFTGVKAPIATVNETRTVMLRQTAPASLDLRPQAGVGPIRDQSSCGSCWTFAIVAAIEYAYWRRNGMVYDLSEQQLVDCVYARSGCEGGWISDATEYISNNCGLTMENNYPYTATGGTCNGASVPKYVHLLPGYPIQQYANDDNTIKNALANYGVLSVYVDATGWSSYSSGIFYSPLAGANPSTNHAVALVGYGTENGVPYWIIRNSWNTWWGEQGYMRLDARRFTNGNTFGGIFTQYVYAPMLT